MPEKEAPELDARTRYCGVLGHPIRHSASPALQNAGMQALGLNWRYLAFDVHPDHLGEAIAGAKAMKFVGLNLTVPHKVLAFEMVDEVDESARHWGAVNTIRFEAQDAAGVWKPMVELTDPVSDQVRTRGFNTDADAITESLREEFQWEPKDGRVLLLGAGGAGQAAALKLAFDQIAELYLINRTFTKADALAAEIRRRFPGVKVYTDYPEDGTADVIINATSLGLKSEDPLPLDTRRFELRNAKFVYDMIYRPGEPPLLKQAKAAGCRTANGAGMLLHQGARSLEIWSGRPAPIPVMRSALQKHLHEH